MVFAGDWGESLTKLMCLFSKIEKNLVVVPWCVYRCASHWPVNGGVVCTHTHTHLNKRSFVRPANRSIRLNEKCIIQSPLVCVCASCWRHIFLSHSPNEAGKSESDINSEAAINTWSSHTGMPTHITTNAHNNNNLYDFSMELEEIINCSMCWRLGAGEWWHNAQCR